jgi:hypothetical protein
MIIFYVYLSTKASSPKMHLSVSWIISLLNPRPTYSWAYHYMDNLETPPTSHGKTQSVMFPAQTSFYIPYFIE